MATTINANNTDGVVITPDTSGELELQANGVTKAKITSAGLQDANGAYFGKGMYRNLIINGDMQIDQRGNLPLTNSTDEGDIWLVDRFKSRMFYATGAVDMSYEQRTDGLVKLTSNFNANMASGDNNWFRVMTALEQREANYVAGKTITVSFDFESNISGDFSVGITMGNGAGASTNKDYATLFSYTTGAVQRITKTITIPDSVPQNGGLNDTGLLLYLAGVADTTNGQYVITPDTWGNTNGWVATGTTNWIQSGNWIALGNVQLEVGEGASDFEFLPYDVQLARCLRYCYQQTFTDNYENIVGVACYSASASFGVIRYPVIMRTPPTFSFGGVLNQFGVFHSGAGRYLTSFSPNEVSTSTMQLGCIVASGFTGGHAGWLRLYNIAVDGSQYIRFDAEL